MLFVEVIYLQTIIQTLHKIYSILKNEINYDFYLFIFFFVICILSNNKNNNFISKSTLIFMLYNKLTYLGLIIRNV